MREYVSKVELGHSWSINFFSARDEQCCFGAIMVSDGEYGVVTILHVDCSYVFSFYMFYLFPPTSPAVPVHDPSG